MLFRSDRLAHELHAAHGLTLPDYEILVHLSEAPDRSLLMSELAGRCLVSQSRLTYRIDRLEREGIVARRPCAEDGRRIWATLTDAGNPRLTAAHPTHLPGVRPHARKKPRAADQPSTAAAPDATVSRCSRGDRTARTATETFPPSRSEPGSAPSNARTAPPALTGPCAASARTARVS